MKYMKDLVSQGRSFDITEKTYDKLVLYLGSIPITEIYPDDDTLYYTTEFSKGIDGLVYSIVIWEGKLINFTEDYNDHWGRVI